MVELKDDGTIIYEGKEVGYFGWNENTIIDVHVKKAYRNQGIATECVSILEDRLKGEYNRIDSTVVLSTAMEKVLQKSNFCCEVKEVVPDHVPEDMVKDDSISVPMEEEIIWYKEI